MKLNKFKINEIKSKKNLTIAVICEKLGITPATYHNYINEKTDATLEFVLQLSKILDIDIEEITFNDNINKSQSIPMIPVEAMAGLGDLPVSITSGDIKEKYVVPEFTDLKVDFLIRVKGSSMYPKYNSGDIIACKMINESSFIQWNRVHVVHTNTQGALVKRLQKHPDPKLITLASDNPNYPPFEVPRTEITNIALVYGVIRLE